MPPTRPPGPPAPGDVEFVGPVDLEAARQAAAKARQRADGLSPDQVYTGLEVLDPSFRLPLTRILARLRAQGFEPWVFETYRSPARQAYLFSIGRTIQLNRRPVTNVQKPGQHFHGIAADVIDGRRHPSKSRRVGWGGDGADAMAMAFFAAFGREAKKERLIWGGDWKMKDYPHVELAQKQPTIA